MDHALFRQAILDDPDDDAPRLVYADWLEERGSPDRAVWIRTSCEYARLSYGDERRWQVLDRVFDNFNRCRPPWWEKITNVEQNNDRGIFRFVLGAVRTGRGPTPVKRLGKVAWLGQALDEGWLQRIELLWDDGELGKLVARWKEPASRIPLLVRPAPQMGDDGLRGVLSLPQLEGLDLLPNVLRNPAVQELASHPNLRDLTVDFRLVDSTIVDLVLDQIAGMPGLRRLHLKGHHRIEYGDRPNDSDLRHLIGVADLKQLYLSDSPAVTEGGIEQLQRERPALFIKRAH